MSTGQELEQVARLEQQVARLIAHYQNSQKSLD